MLTVSLHLFLNRESCCPNVKTAAKVYLRTNRDITSCHSVEERERERERERGREREEEERGELESQKKESN